MGNLPERAEAVTGTEKSGRKGKIFDTQKTRDLLQVDMPWRRRRRRRKERVGGRLAQ